MKKIFIGFLLPLFVFAQDNVTVFTENYPPFNYEEDSELKGLSVEVLDAMSKKMGEEIQPKLINWSRGYTITQKKKNNVIFSTAKTKAREDMFKWVGPICESRKELIALKDRNIKISSLNELENYKIGTVLKDVGESLLLENGVSKDNIYPASGVSAIELSFKKLNNKRIDLFSYELIVARFEAQKIGLNPNKYESVFILSNSELYFAFNKDTDDKIINKWQKALDDIKADGTYAKIMNKYNKQ